MSRILSIDYGDKYIGLAITDPLCIIATPLITIIRKDIFTIKPYVQKIKEIVKEKEVTKIVLGFPKNMNDTLGSRAEITMQFMDRLRNNIKNVEIILIDERLSTIAANNILNETSVKKSKKKDVIDQISACLILQDYLNYTKSNT